MRPIATVFFRPSLSPKAKAVMAPKKAPSCQYSVSNIANKSSAVYDTTYREATGCYAGYVRIQSFWEMFLKVCRDQDP